MNWKILGRVGERYRDWDFISSFQETLLKKQCLIQEDSDRVWGMDLYVGSLISNPRSKNETRSEWNKGGGKINIRCFLRLSSWANEILIINGQFVKPESSIWRIEGGNATHQILFPLFKGFLWRNYLILLNYACAKAQQTELDFVVIKQESKKWASGSLCTAYGVSASGTLWKAS